MLPGKDNNRIKLVAVKLLFNCNYETLGDRF